MSHDLYPYNDQYFENAPDTDDEREAYKAWSDYVLPKTHSPRTEFLNGFIAGRRSREEEFYRIKRDADNWSLKQSGNIIELTKQRDEWRKDAEDNFKKLAQAYAELAEAKLSSDADTHKARKETDRMTPEQEANPLKTLQEIELLLDPHPSPGGDVVWLVKHQRDSLLDECARIATTHGVLWGCARGTETPSTVPEIEIGKAIVALKTGHKDDKMTNEPVSVAAMAYADKLFPCKKPCDSYGICEGCSERTIFLAGYNFGYRAAKTLSEPGEPKQT